MANVKASIALEMQFSGSAGAWTDVVGDVLVKPGIQGSYGIMNNGPLDRVARPARINFSLRNDALNSGGLLGYYSPEHDNVRSGFEIGIGTRLAITYSGSTFYKWRGELSSADPDPGRYRSRRTRVQALGWLNIAAKNRVSQQDIAFDQSADQGIATLIEGMTDLPPASSLATGQDTFPTIFDTSRDESTAIIREIYKLVISELGYLYPKGDQVTGGVITFEDRHARPKYGSSAASLNDSMVKLQPDRSTANIFNRVKVQVAPREISAAASILFSLQSTPLIGTGASMVIEGRYTDPEQRGSIRIGGASMITPASTTDFTMNSASDGGGTDLTSKFSVAASLGGNSVRFSVVNDGTQQGYVTLLQTRGNVVAVKEPTIAEKKDQDSIDAYGEAVLRLNMQYQEDPLVAEDASSALLANWKDPLTQVRTIEFIGNESDALMKVGLQLEPGDKVTLIEDVTGLDHEFFINGVTINIKGADIISFEWVVIPAGAQQFWILGTVGSSELGISTIPGY